MSIVSYAQNFEDVMLWRALGHVDKGFYIDIGAQDPKVDSVSRAFYEAGWRGVHVEPNARYAELLRKDRPDEVVLQAAIGSRKGLIAFYEVEGSGLSTCAPKIAEQHRNEGRTVSKTMVTALTLDTLFGEISAREIHWLKVDVEGLEKQVISGWRKSRRRPWVVVIESTYPNSQIPSHEEWESMLLQKGYGFQYSDGLNRYYVANDQPSLKAAFTFGAGVFDNFQLAESAWSVVHIRQRHQAQLAEFEERARVHEERHSAQQVELQRVTVEFESREKIWRTESEQLARQMCEVAESRAAELLRCLEEERASAIAARAKASEDEQVLVAQLAALKAEAEEAERGFAVQVAALKSKASEDEQALVGQVAALKAEAQEAERAFVAQLTALKSKASEDEQALVGQVAALKAEAQEAERAFAAQMAALKSEANEASQAFERKVAQLQDDARALARERDVARIESKALGLQLAEREQTNAEQLAQLNRHVQSVTEEAQALSVALQQQQMHSVARERELVGQVQAIESEFRVVQNQLSASRELAQQAALQFVDRERELVDRIDSLEQSNEAQSAQSTRRLDAMERQFKESLMQREQSFTAHIAQLFDAFRGEAANNERDLDSIIRRAEMADENLRRWQLKLANRLSDEASHLRGLIVSGLEAADGEGRPALNPSLRIPYRESEEEIKAIGNVDQLIALHDEAFVNAAYRLLLGRAPDPDGKAFYLARVRSGYPKQWVLAQLRLSGEGQERGVGLTGLEGVISRELKAQRSMGFWLSQKLGAGGSHDEHKRRLRAFENRLGCLLQEAAASLDEIGRGIRGSTPDLVEMRQTLGSFRSAWSERQGQIALAITPQQVPADQPMVSASAPVITTSQNLPDAPLNPSEVVALTRLSARAKSFYLRVGRTPTSRLKGESCVS
jgi:FkbM family methyltransferase